MIIRLPGIKMVVPHKKHRIIFGDKFTKMCILISPLAVWQIIEFATKLYEIIKDKGWIG